MSYMLRDRPDGQFEIILDRPVLVGIFPERDTAEKVCAFLASDEPDLPDDCPSSFGRAVRDVQEAEQEGFLDAVDAPDKPTEAGCQPAVGPIGKVANLPALRKKPKPPATKDEKPRMPAQLRFDGYWPLSEEETLKAFQRIQQGEKIVDVVRDYPTVTMGQLRGKWANHKRNLQKFMAEAGPQPCTVCAREFTPSVSNPYTCARCSK